MDSTDNNQTKKCEHMYMVHDVLNKVFNKIPKTSLLQNQSFLKKHIRNVFLPWAGLVLGTVLVDDTLWPAAAVRVAEILGPTRAHTRVAAHRRVRVGAAGVGVARVPGRGRCWKIKEVKKSQILLEKSCVSNPSYDRSWSSHCELEKLIRIFMKFLTHQVKM